MVPHVWFRLLPSNGDNYDTVAFAVGQEWELFSKLLHEVKILKKRGGKVIVDVQKLKTLSYRDDLIKPVYYGYSRGQKKPLVHYLCSGEPMFNSPARQEFSGHVFARLRYHTRRDRRITTKLQELINKIDTSHVQQHI